MIDLAKLSKPWKKVLVGLSPGPVPGLGPLPKDVEIVEVIVKLYGEGLPEMFRTPEGERIKFISVEALAELTGGKTDVEAH